MQEYIMMNVMMMGFEAKMGIFFYDISTIDISSLDL